MPGPAIGTAYQPQAQPNEKPAPAAGNEGFGSFIGDALTRIGQQLVTLPPSQEQAITPTPSPPPPPPTAPGQAEQPLPALTDSHLTMSPPTPPAAHAGPPASPQYTPPPQVTPDQAPFHVGLPSFDPAMMGQRVSSVINVARQMTGGLLQPEVIHDLARSALPMDQVANVIGFIMNNGGQRDAALGETELMAHNITQSTQNTIGNYLQGVGQRIVAGATQPFQEFTAPGAGFSAGPRAALDVFGGSMPGVLALTSLSASLSTDVSQAMNRGSAFDDQLGLWAPDATGNIVNTKTGQVVTPFSPEWDQMMQTQRLAASTPHVGMQNSNLTNGSALPHTVTDIRNDLAAGGWIKDANQTGPLRQDEIAALAQYYSHTGGQMVALQLEMQAKQFGGSLPITGFFNPTNPDGSVNETGAAWLAVQNDYQQSAQLAHDYIAQHPEDGVMARDLGIGETIIAIKSGNMEWAGQAFKRFNAGWQRTPTTKGVPVIAQAEMGLRGAMLLATNFGQLFNALPNSSDISLKIQEDSQWQDFLKQAINTGQVDREQYRKMQEMGGKQGFDVVMAAVTDPVLRDQMHQLSLKYLTQFGYYNAQGGPLSPTNRYLGGVTELLNDTLNPVPAARLAVDNYIEERPLVADAANMVLTWKMFPGRMGATVRGAPGVEGMWRAASDGVINKIANEQITAYNAERAAAQDRIASIAQTGTSHPHVGETGPGEVADPSGKLNFRPSQVIQQGVDEYHGAAPTQFVVEAVKDEGAAVDMAVAKEQHLHPGSEMRGVAPAEPVANVGAETPKTSPSASNGNIASTARYGEKSSAELAQSVQDTGGFTYQPHAKLTPTNGYAVVANKAAEGSMRHAVIAADHPNVAGEIDRFVASNKSLKNVNNAMRAWKDDTGAIHLEISRVVKTEAEAIKLGKANKQEYYYDVAKGESKPVTQAGEVPHQPVGPRTGPVAEGTTRHFYQAHSPWEYNSLRAATAGRDVKIYDAAGNEISEIPKYAGPVMTKAAMREIVASRLDALNVGRAGVLTTRLTLPVRFNLFADRMAFDSKLAPLFRQLTVKAYNGVLDFNDPSVIDKIRTIVRHTVHDPVLARGMMDDAMAAYRQGPRGYLQSESVVHQLIDNVVNNFTGVSRSSIAQEIERQGNAAGFGMPNAAGTLTERSVFNTELGGYSAYMPAIARAVAKSKGLSFLKDASWPTSQGMQTAWKIMDDTTSKIAVNTSDTLNKLNYYVVRKWATYVSLPFQGKVYTRMAWVTLTTGTKASKAEKAWAKEVLGRDPEGYRLVHEVIRRQQAGDTTWYFGGKGGDKGLADGFARRVNSAQVQGVFRDVYGGKLDELLNKAGGAPAEPSWRLRAGSQKDSYDILNPAGEVTGSTHISESPLGTGPAFVHNIEAKEGPGAIGAAGLKSIFRQYFDEHPNVTSIDGIRASGSRTTLGTQASGVSREQKMARESATPYDQMGASLKMTIAEIKSRITAAEAVPRGGDEYIGAQATLEGLQKDLVRHENGLKAWGENVVTPINGGHDASVKALSEWLQTPAGQFFKDSNTAATGGAWSKELDASYPQTAASHLTSMWFDRPNVRDAVLKGERDGKSLLKIAKHNNELYEADGKTWFPTKEPDKDSENPLKDAIKAVDAGANKISYFALKNAKKTVFEDLQAKYLYGMKDAIADGRVSESDAVTSSAFRARDMSNDLMFDLQSSMLQVEMRLRFLAPFATKRRLFWQHIGGRVMTDPRIQMAMAEVSQHIEAMNVNENEHNKDKITFTLPIGILGYAAGSTVDYHLYNQLWLGQGDELENYAMLQAAKNFISGGGTNAADPSQQFKSVFGYYPSASSPNASLFPRVSDVAHWIYGAAAMQGVMGNKTIAEIYDRMPPDMVAQHQITTNAIQAQAYRSGRTLTPNEAAKAAFIDLLLHSVAKVGLPGAPGITPAEQVAARSEVQQYWAATSKQQILDLEAKYPGLQTELKLTRNPDEFKQWLVSSAKANIIQGQFAKDSLNFTASHPVTALIDDKVAIEAYAQLKLARDNAYAQLASDYPIWGESHGYGYRDANGSWVANDEVKKMLADRGSKPELKDGQTGALQQAEAMYSNFIDANNIVPVSKADHDTLKKVLDTYSSLDQAIARFSATDASNPITPENEKILADLRAKRAQYIGQYQSILDAYWPHGQQTVLEAAREQYYKDVYTPWVAAQKTIFDQLDPTVNPWLTKKQKGALEDQLTAIKDKFNHPFTLPQYPGTTFPPPEQINWQHRSPMNQAIDLAKWQVIGSRNPAWLTTFQQSLLSDTKMLGQMISGWDRPTYNMYLATLKDELAKFSGGFGGFGGSSQEKAEDAWRRQVKANGREAGLSMFNKNRVAVTDEPATPRKANVFA